MGVNYSNAISIVELIAYLPSFFLAAFLVYRHGVSRSGGFVFLVIFTLARIIGSACNLATINNPSTDLFTAAAICSSIGLSPLLMTCSGLLSRANLTMATPALPKRILSLFRILTIVAVALSISGITSTMSDSDSSLSNGTTNTQVKVGMILYLVSWVFLLALLSLLYINRTRIPKGEYRCLGAVAVSAPFLLVRIIYAMLVWFVARGAFTAVGGDHTAQLFLSVLVEMGVVFVCLGVGFTLRVRGREMPMPVGGGRGQEMA